MLNCVYDIICISHYKPFTPNVKVVLGIIAFHQTNYSVYKAIVSRYRVNIVALTSLSYFAGKQNVRRHQSRRSKHSICFTVWLGRCMLAAVN